MWNLDLVFQISSVWDKEYNLHVTVAGHTILFIANLILVKCIFIITNY